MLRTGYGEGRYTMNNDDEEDDIIQAEQGPLNPYWMLRSISLHSTLSMFIRGMFGVSFYLEKRQGEYLDPLEIVDVIIQYMYTGEYSYPFPDEDQEEWRSEEHTSELQSRGHLV